MHFLRSPRLALFSLFAVACAAQTKPAPAAALELPVYLRQNIEAGKSPVGMNVEARLTLATLVDKKVIPAGATISGLVVVSQFRTATAPARLAVRFDSAQWKDGATPGMLMFEPKVYLTSWCYPIALAQPGSPETLSGEVVLQHGRTGSRTSSANGEDASNRRPFDTSDPLSSERPSSIPQHRERIKGVESTRGPDGVLVLSSQPSKLKFDRSLAYVLAPSDPSGTK